MPVECWIDYDRRLRCRDAFDNAGQIQRKCVIETEDLLGKLGVGRRRIATAVERRYHIRNVNGRRKRSSFIRICVRKTALRTECGWIAGDVQIINVLQQIGRKEERVDLVLVFSRFGKLVHLVCTGLKRCRVIFRKMPRA